MSQHILDEVVHGWSEWDLFGDVPIARLTGMFPLQFLTKVDEISLLLAREGSQINYRKYAKIFWIENFVQLLASSIAGFALCAVIHPFGQPFIEQFRCLIVFLQISIWLSILTLWNFRQFAPFRSSTHWCQQFYSLTCFYWCWCCSKKPTNSSKHR